MIRRLRRRLMGVSMLALFLVLAVIMSALNGLNYRRITAQADTTLAILVEGGGSFPHDFGERLPGKRPDLGNRDPSAAASPDDELHRFSPELPFMSRYCSVTFAADGTVQSADTSRIAAVDEATAVAMATPLADKVGESGYSGNYRYTVHTADGGTRVIFLDCERELSTFRAFLWRSCAISLIGLCAVFLLIWLLSARIVRPIAESYAKQRRFVTDAGHELKTPLTIIDADAELLGMEVGEENEWLCDIRRQTERLSRLTADLIYLSRLDEPREAAGAQMLDFPFSDVVAETAQSFAAPYATRGLTLTLDVEPMLTLRGDEARVRQLVSLLLDNAGKYASADSEVTLSAARQGRAVTLTVANPAPPMAKEQLSHLFDRFYRADPARTGEGHGLGLSIARAIAEAHRGKIAAENRGGRLAIVVTLVG